MPDFRGFTEFIKDTFGYIITFIVIALIFTFVVAVAPVAGNSMSPTLNDGDMVIVSRCSYLFTDIKRNEIVIFKDSNKKKYVKRVIGLPGERIDYLNGYLHINGETYEENLINAETNNFMFEDICPEYNCPASVIPENHYLVLGDNRGESQDSRDPIIGLVSKNKIMGKIVFRILPFSDFGATK